MHRIDFTSLFEVLLPDGAQKYGLLHDIEPDSEGFVYAPDKPGLGADIDFELIKRKQVAIIGYGSQGHAHALNLKDSGVNVTVALRKGGASWAKAQNAGLAVKEIAEAAKEAECVEQERATQVKEVAANEGATPVSHSAPVIVTPTVKQDDGALIKLGDINARIAPLSITADGLSQLGFAHVATDRSAKLYRQSDFGAIRKAMVYHLNTVTE